MVCRKHSRAHGSWRLASQVRPVALNPPRDCIVSSRSSRVWPPAPSNDGAMDAHFEVALAAGGEHLTGAAEDSQILELAMVTFSYALEATRMASPRI